MRDEEKPLIAFAAPATKFTAVAPVGKFAAIPFAMRKTRPDSALFQRDVLDDSRVCTLRRKCRLSTRLWLNESLQASGVEVFSLLRESGLAPSEYIDAFFDSGTERERT